MNTEEEPKTCSICYCIWCKRTLPQRYVVSIMLILAPIIFYIQRVCLNLAIVNMTNWKTPIQTEKNCYRNESSVAMFVEINDETFDWDESIQSYILLSFFIGYMIGNFFIGFIINISGGSKCIYIGGAISSLMTFGIPLLTYYTHWGFICAARILSGIGQSTLYSSSSTLLARWIPEKHKSSISSMMLMSFTIGIVIGNVGTGYIMKFTQTWCWVYYIFGASGFIWVFFFFFYIYANPQTHPHLTQKERELLEEIPKARHTQIPFSKIMSDCAVWMFFLAFFGSDFTVYIIVTNMPKYFVEVLGLSTPVTGMILMGPPLAGAVGGIIIGFLGDFLISRKYLKKLYFRMICTTLGLPLPAFLLLLMVLSECNVTMASVLVTLSMFFQATYYAGVGMMAIDLTMNYPGLLYGYCNVAGGFSGTMAPYLVGYIAYDNTFKQWRIVLYITLALAMIAYIPILMFSKVERKRWDYSAEEQPPPIDDAPFCKKVWSCHNII